jgi:hypothetical protein
MISGTVESSAETAVTDRHEALLRVSQTLISIHSSEELFRVLARELRAVVNFYIMGVESMTRMRTRCVSLRMASQVFPSKSQNLRWKKLSRGGCISINSL